MPLPALACAADDLARTAVSVNRDLDVQEFRLSSLWASCCAKLLMRFRVCEWNYDAAPDFRGSKDGVAERYDILYMTAAVLAQSC
eukprot:6211997-Pleurochrysis_carterae.AAC.1